MKKDNVMFGVFGLIVGLVIGFVFANSVNKTAAVVTPAGQLPAMGSNSASGNPALPADHPPIGTSAGGDPEAGGAAAIAQVTAAIEKAKANPKDFEAQMTAADLYYQIERYNEAATFYEAASKLRPSDTEPMIKLGNSLFDAEKYVEAENYYNQVLAREPRNVNVRNDLGLTFFLREPRDIDRAIREYQSVLSQEADNEIALQNLFLAYREKGDTANLAQTTERLKKVNPSNPVFKQTN